MRHRFPEYVNVRMDTEMKEQLEQIAKDNDVSMAWLIRQAIKTYIEGLNETTE